MTILAGITITLLSFYVGWVIAGLLCGSSKRMVDSVYGRLDDEKRPRKGTGGGAGKWARTAARISSISFRG